MRESWTDDRLDDLREDMNRGFASVREGVNRGDAQLREEIVHLRADMTREFAHVDADVRELRVEMRELRSEMNARFDAMQRAMVIGFATLGGGLLASIAATVLAAVLG